MRFFCLLCEVFPASFPFHGKCWFVVTEIPHVAVPPTKHTLGAPLVLTHGHILQIDICLHYGTAASRCASRDCLVHLRSTTGQVFLISGRAGCPQRCRIREQPYVAVFHTPLPRRKYRNEQLLPAAVTEPDPLMMPVIVPAASSRTHRRCRPRRRRHYVVRTSDEVPTMHSITRRKRRPESP